MSDHVTYASFPAQFSTTFTVAHLASLDHRFHHLRALRGRRALDLVVQDSADLQNAHLTLRSGQAEWLGAPGALDEDGAGRRPFHGWSEAALAYALGVDLTPVELQRVPFTELNDRVAAWRTGVLYAFARVDAGPSPALARRLNLANDMDRLEFDFLAATDFAGLDLVRAHRLNASGAHEVLRASSRADAPVAAAPAERGRLWS